MVYAIIESGNKQYKVSPGDIIEVELLKAAAEDAITIDKVLLFSKDGQIEVGRPHLSDVKVPAKVLGVGKDPKVISFKFKNKTGYHRTKGHRQPFTRLKIEEINLASGGVKG